MKQPLVQSYWQEQIYKQVKIIHVLSLNKKAKI